MNLHVAWRDGSSDDWEEVDPQRLQGPILGWLEYKAKDATVLINLATVALIEETLDSDIQDNLS